MRGMHRDTGKFIQDLAHLRQSIEIILNTPLGSRVMLPEFGSEVIDLIDAPMTPPNRLRLYSAVIDAIERWEPRIDIQNVRVENVTEQGVIEISIRGIYDEREVILEDLALGVIPVPSVPEVPIDPSIPIVPDGIEFMSIGGEFFSINGEIFAITGN